jgi:hypothetical protein
MRIRNWLGKTGGLDSEVENEQDLQTSACQKKKKKIVDARPGRRTLEDVEPDEKENSTQPKQKKLKREKSKQEKPKKEQKQVKRSVRQDKRKVKLQLWENIDKGLKPKTSVKNSQQRKS